MTVAGPKVQDFTDRRRRLPVEIDVSPVYELLLALFVYQSGHGEVDEYERGSTFFETVDDHASSELKADFAELAGCGALWLTMIGIAHEASDRSSVDGFLAHFANGDPVELRRMLLADAGVRPARGFDPGVIGAAAAGDVRAAQALLDQAANGRGKPVDHGLRVLLDLEPSATRDRIADVVSRFNTDVVPHLEPVLPVLRRDAEEKRAMAARMTAERLVETATNGITFEMQPSVSGVLLIPSVIVKPWVVIAEHDTLRIFCYSVSDEHLAADPDAPPTYLVDLYKALGDERRLRILGILADGDAPLSAVAERVDLAKSTTHHHLRVLRSAGLVRVIVGDDDKRYSLRADAVPEAGRLLEGYLGRTRTSL